MRTEIWWATNSTGKPTDIRSVDAASNDLSQSRGRIKSGVNSKTQQRIIFVIGLMEKES
jgi:hypothetical protein